MKRHISALAILAVVGLSIGSAPPAHAVVGTPVIAADISISATHVTVGLPTPVTVDATEEFAIYQLNRGDGVWRNIAGATTSDVPAIQIPLALFPIETNTYSIRIRGTAVDISDGALLEGSPSNAVSVRLKADAPTAVTVLPAPADSLAVTFTPPLALEAAGVIGFEYSIDGGLIWQDSGAEVTATGFAIAGLASGDQVDVQVRAVNAGFAGVASETVAARVGIPEAPIGVVATPRLDAGEVNVVWEIPDTFAGSAIERVEYAVGDGAWEGSLTADVTSVVVTGLVDGLATTIKVRAVNGAGDGLVGVSPAVVVGSPRAPVIGSIAPANAQLIVTLGSPSTQVSTATFTRYQYSVDDGATWKIFSPDATSISAEVLVATGLTNDQTYQLLVRGLNSNGAGPASIAVAGTPTIPIPGAATVTSVTGVAGNPTMLRVVFAAPGNAVSSGVTTYQYSVNAGPWRDRSVGTTNSPMEITGLSAGTTVSVRVRGVNQTAEIFGSPSNAVAGTTVAASGGGGGSAGGGGGGGGGGGAPAPESEPVRPNPPPDTPAPDRTPVAQPSAPADVEVVRSMTVTQVKALTPEQLSSMNVAAFAAFSPEQVRALGPGQLREVSAAQVAAIPVVAIRAMRPGTLRSLTVRQIRALSPAQARVLNPKQVRALGPTKRRVVKERRESGLEFRLLL
jgi:hypothetical protein